MALRASILLAGGKQERPRLFRNIHQRKGRVKLGEMMGEDSKCSRMERWLRAAERPQLRYLQTSATLSASLGSQAHHF